MYFEIPNRVDRDATEDMFLPRQAMAEPNYHSTGSHQHLGLVEKAAGDFRRRQKIAVYDDHKIDSG